MTEMFDLDRFFSLPRLSNLRLSPDGTRLVVAVARLDAEGKKYVSALWQVDPQGTQAPRRLTWSAAGESDARFASDGSLLFSSARPDPEAKPGDDDPPPGLWRLPAEGGEARLLAAPKAGVDALRVAAAAPTVAFAAGMFPGADLEADEEREKARKEAGVEALLLEGYPIRWWDHWLGPRHRHLLAASLPAGSDDRLGDPRDLTPDVAQGFEEQGFDVSPDGSTIVAAIQRLAPLMDQVIDLVLIDAATGERRTITPGDEWYADPVFAPDGRTVACVRIQRPHPDQAERHTLWLVDVETGRGRDATSDLDLWPHDLVWSHDGAALFFLADRQGHVAAFRLEPGSGEVTCLVADGTLADLCPSPDGRTVYALRSTQARPNHLVRFDARGENQQVEVVPSPAPDAVDTPGILERLEAPATDGQPVGSWLLRPPDASAESPAPLLVFVHGGPLGTWTDGWHWRWNPQLLVARGYAVLLPDPALSTGYGQAFIERGWGRWGAEPYTDIVAAVDAALTRPDLDATRTALLGGSFGGYMANWVAGQTDRFRAIVTHASLWNLRGFHGTTDYGPYLEGEFGDAYGDLSRYHAHSPDRQVSQIRTPMLVIHGERDHRVPISEALQLWMDLQRHGVDARFLYFPDENHWILKPRNARLWYETVLAFLDQHVLGKEWVRPALL